MTLEAVVGHLEPSMEDLGALQQAAEASVRDTLKAMGEVQLNAEKAAIAPARPATLARIPAAEVSSSSY